MNGMQNRNSASAGGPAGRRVAELNEAAKEIAKGSNSSSASRFERLDDAAASADGRTQQSINMQSQQLGQGGMSQERAAQMQRLTQQQRELQKSLEGIVG